MTPAAAPKGDATPLALTALPSHTSAAAPPPRPAPSTPSTAPTTPTPATCATPAQRPAATIAQLLAQHCVLSEGRPSAGAGGGPTASTGCYSLHLHGAQLPAVPPQLPVDGDVPPCLRALARSAMPAPPTGPWRCTALDMSFNRLTSLEGVSRPASLQTLDVSMNFVRKVHPTDVSALTRLTKLNLSNNALTSVSWAATLPALTHLDVSLNSVAALEGLTRHGKKLRSLNVMGNELESLRGLEQLHGLKSLDGAPGRWLRNCTPWCGQLRDTVLLVPLLLLVWVAVAAQRLATGSPTRPFWLPTRR